MAQVELIMPKMGESVAEATIIKWLKKEGDKINADETVLEIATDKVDSEIPAPYTGKLKKILAQVGQIIAALLGVAWSITTFFVVPVLAYEGLSPIASYKRSIQIMKEKWGESLGATFSFTIIQILAVLLIAIPMFFIGSMISIIAGIVFAVIGTFFVFTVISAAQTIFISAVYHKINEMPTQDFNSDTLDDIFIHKEKKGLF